MVLSLKYVINIFNFESNTLFKSMLKYMKYKLVLLIKMKSLIKANYFTFVGCYIS